MKTNKTLLVTLAIALVISLGISSTYAYGWNWNWQWQGQWQWKNQSTQQWFWSGSQAKQSQEHNPSDMLVDIEKQDVDSVEIDLLEKQYEEEVMANELYTYFYDMYGVETFKNIANSEAEHMVAVEALLDRYEISVPTDYEHIESLYNELKEKGEQSLLDALEVWVSIEIVDIEDIITAIKSTDNDDIKVVLTNIWGASYNHMRGFVNALENNWLETDIDYSDYLTEDDLATKGTIKVKLAERLEDEWVDLPEQASSSYIQENCDNEWNLDSANKGSERSNQVNKWQQWKMQSNYNSLKNEYKEKYSSTVAKLDNDKLTTLVEKIDELAEKINWWNYSDTTKEKYNSVLLALRELAIENLEEDEIDIDSLF